MSPQRNRNFSSYFWYNNNHTPCQQNLSSCSCGCLASFNSSSPLISLCAVVPSLPSNNLEANSATIPPMATSTALCKISLPKTISAWFCLGMRPPIERTIIRTVTVHSTKTADTGRVGFSITLLRESEIQLRFINSANYKYTYQNCLITLGCAWWAF